MQHLWGFCRLTEKLEAVNCVLSLCKHMSQKPNMLSASKPWDMVADGYADTTMQMLAYYACAGWLAT